MKRIAMLMILCCALVALGSFPPFTTHAAVACDGDGDGDGGGSGGGDSGK